MQKQTTLFKAFEGVIQVRGCTVSKTRITHKRAAAPQRTTDHGDRGARRSSGRCLTNGPAGCRIFANYCGSVCVRAGGKLRPNLETTSGEELRCPNLCPISGRNTLFGGFFDLGKISEPTVVSTCRVHGSYKLYDLHAHRGTIKSNLGTEGSRPKFSTKPGLRAGALYAGLLPAIVPRPPGPPCHGFVVLNKSSFITPLRVAVLRKLPPCPTLRPISQMLRNARFSTSRRPRSIPYTRFRGYRQMRQADQLSLLGWATCAINTGGRLSSPERCFVLSRHCFPPFYDNLTPLLARLLTHLAAPKCVVHW